MSHGPGRHLFTYAVFTDTHLNQGESECNSPFEVNRLANARMRHVIGDLNRHDLRFVIHLGDLLHPVPAIPHLYQRAAACFKEQVAELRHPLYLIPGNHDVGDKPIEWGPAGVVCEEYLDLWRQHFGANHQVFDHGECRFFLLDAQIINSGLEAELQQRRWLEQELSLSEGRRIFINLHYPPYLTDPEEDEHYDNIGEPGRSWLLGLLEGHAVEALFAGHVHNFWYHRHAGTHCYLLPSTAFVRQDYAEMYRAAPAPDMQAGRNDAAKLGYFLVHVHEGGHLCEVVRTYGAVVEAGSTVPDARERVAPVHPACNPLDRFGFDMRQNWLELIEIPPSGGLDEFDRKRTRNDYGLMALLEMGVRRVRIPARDLVDADHRARLEHCHALGLRFTLFSFGVPRQRLLAAVEKAAHLLDAWEVAHTAGRLADAAAVAASVTGPLGIALYLSKLRSKDEMERGGEKYYHMINHGFVMDDLAQIATLGEMAGVDGVVFRVAGEMSPWSVSRQAADLCAACGLLASLHVRMSLGSPGARQGDEAWVSVRAMEALAAAAAHGGVRAYLDAFADMDRGYFVRQGVVDRLYNPRPAFHVVRHLNAVLASRCADDSPAFSATGDTGAVVLRDGEGTRIEIVSQGQASGPVADSPTGEGSVVDLLAGERWPARHRGGGQFEPPLPPGPCLWLTGP